MTGVELEIGLAATKLEPPTLPARLVRRTRLDALLEEAVGEHSRLVLVSAPAGSGKSTLVASWLAEFGSPASWLQVEAADSDPVRFWTYLVESVGRAVPEVARNVGPVVSASRGDADAVVSALVTALAERPHPERPLPIVIDDYHLITDGSIHGGVERLTGLCPTGVTVVVVTRMDPPFRLGRLRVRGHMVEVRASDLRFEGEEALGLLGPTSREWSPRHVDVLAARTEGWAAGLVLAGMSMERAPDVERFIDDFRGDDHLVVDYLSEEFLAGVAPEQREMLLKTSILDRFNGELVEVVTGIEDGRAWLARTAAANQLLIGLDRTGEWFRYHHLLGDLLRMEADRALGEGVGELHRRAARWFESSGDERRAVDHWLAAGDPTEAGKVMRSYGTRLIATGQMAGLERILERLGDVRGALPWCALFQGWCDYVAGRFDSARQWVERVHELSTEDSVTTVTAALRMNLHLAQGRVGAALAIAGELAAGGEVEAHTSDLATVAGGVFTWAGREDEARATLSLALERTTVEGIGSAHLLARNYLTVLEFETGRREDAHREAEATIATAAELGMSSYYRMGPAYAVRARTADDPEGALADARRAVELVRRTTGDLVLAHVLAICGDTLTDLGRAEGPELVDEARAIVDRLPDPGIVGRNIERVLSRHGVAAVAPAVPGMVEPLTEREMAVLRFLPTAMSQREIAGELFVSPNTVKTHCRAIYRKLGVGNRKAAVQAARDRGVL